MLQLLAKNSMASKNALARLMGKVKGMAPKALHPMAISMAFNSQAPCPALPSQDDRPAGEVCGDCWNLVRGAGGASLGMQRRRDC
eukprot:749528-Hanusia_phi.AAC.4